MSTDPEKQMAAAGAHPELQFPSTLDPEKLLAFDLEKQSAISEADKSDYADQSESTEPRGLDDDEELTALPQTPPRKKTLPTITTSAPAPVPTPAPAPGPQPPRGPPPDPIHSDDPNVVTWDGASDPANPRNWTTRAKVTNTLLIILLTLLTPLASSMFAPAVPQVLAEFHTSSDTIAALVVSIYILGFAIGPLIIAPLSELYGRWPVYVVCNGIFIVFNVACAVARTMPQLIVFRFLAGAAGVCPVALGGASIADLIVQEKRGGAMALYAMGPLMGPVIGPICGAYLSEHVSWRWNFWVLAIASGTFTILHALFCRETYAPVLLERKTRRLREETGNPDLRSALQPKIAKRQYITRAMVRPFKMLFGQPMVFCMSVYVAIMFGVLYLLYTTYTFVFEDNYHFSEGSAGLTYLGSGIGFFIALFINGRLSDKILKAKAAKNGGKLKPEYRLFFLVCVAPLAPAGLFIYGWTTNYHVQWAVPLLGTLLFGVTLIGCMMCVQMYLIDAYTVYAASAIAANTVLRSIVAGLLPLSGLSLYNKLGLGWGNSVIAFIALAVAPIPFIFYRYGERIRQRGTINF